jgi:hypothetical protein
MSLILSMILLSLINFCPEIYAASVPRNYVFFNLDRERIKESWFIDRTIFHGAQIKYRWKTIEPKKDEYDFREIEEDLAFLESKGKRLFLQLQDVTFDPTLKNIPAYLEKEPEYHGGAELQYYFSDDIDADPQKAGWVSRRWDPSVAGRFHKLLAELGRRFDGRIAGITLPETSVDFGSTGKFYPSGFSPAVYADAIKGNMDAAKTAFNRSLVIQYANFMPGEWLPWDDKGYLLSVFEEAEKLGIGVGGPDIIPYRKGQMNHSYALAQKFRGRVGLGYAVQEGNYSQTNAKTGKRMTVQDIYDFAASVLWTEFIFWYPEEPYFSRDVLPYLKNLRK